MVMFGKVSMVLRNLKSPNLRHSSMTSEYSRTQVLRHRPSYLADLQMLMGWPVAADDLLSTDESLFIREGKFKKCPKMERHFRAGFVGSNDFFELLGILQKLNPSPISVWITHTRGIGALVVPTLRDISYTYAFQIVGELAAFVTTDGNDRLLVVNDLDDRSETIELQGVNWSNAFDLFKGGIVVHPPPRKGMRH